MNFGAINNNLIKTRQDGGEEQQPMVQAVQRWWIDETNEWSWNEANEIRIKWVSGGGRRGCYQILLIPDCEEEI